MDEFRHLGVGILFWSIPIIVVILISIVSRSYQTDALLSLVSLVPLFLLHTIYIRKKDKRMGAQLIELKKSSSEENSLRIDSIFILVATIVFTVSTYLSGHRLAIWWLFYFAYLLLENITMNKFLRKCLMENGISFDRKLIAWDKIESYEWVNPRKKKEFTYLNISYKTIPFQKKAYLTIFDDQKGEVDKLFMKMVKTERQTSNR